MKKLLMLSFALVFVWATGASASTYTIPISDLLDEDNFVDQGCSSPASETSRTQDGSYVEYTFSAVDTSTATLAKVQVGDSFDLPYDNAGFGISSMPLASDRLGNLIDYDDYSLAVCRTYQWNFPPISHSIFKMTWSKVKTIRK